MQLPEGNQNENEDIGCLDTGITGCKSQVNCYSPKLNLLSDMRNKITNCYMRAEVKTSALNTSIRVSFQSISWPRHH